MGFRHPAIDQSKERIAYSCGLIHLRPHAAIYSILAFDWSIARCLNPIVAASKQNAVVKNAARDYTAIVRKHVVSQLWRLSIWALYYRE